MTEPSAGSEPGTAPPSTGDRAVDEALADVHELDQHPLSEHYERLAHAHETLHATLHRDPAG